MEAAAGLADLRARHRIEKREMFERAAARVFARDGFDAASVADVAAEAGTSTGSIYNYFSSKEELLFAATFSELAELELRMRAAIAADEPADQQLRAMIGAYHDFHRDRPEGFRMVVAGLDRTVRVKGGAEMVGEYDRRALSCLALLRDVLADGMRAGTFKESDPGETARVIWAAAHGSLHISMSGLQWDARRLLDRMGELIFESINTRGQT